jgi:4-amino-4-deoxy-L-arabinose transferase-like glycosyltransferase
MTSTFDRPGGPRSQGQEDESAKRLDVIGARTLAWLDGRRGLAWWLCLLVITLSAADAWASRHQINSDGISYIDLGNTVFAHGIKAGASVAWSPMYTWLLGGVLKLLHPSRQHELAVVLGVDVVIVAVVLIAFTWWLQELTALLRERGAAPVISESAQLVLAYGVAAWVIWREVPATLVTPDLLLAAPAFAATAALVHIARRGGSPVTWLGLGVLLGVGYLVKSGFVLPAIVGCAACAVLTRGGALRRLTALAITGAVCLCVASPFIAVLSSKEGHLEIGGYGSLNYAWDVDSVTPYLNWTGGDGEFGRPVHPTLIASAPLTFAYPSPIGGSIPVWYNPAYWYEGVQPRFLLGPQISAIGSGVKVVLRTVLVGPLLLLLALAAFMLWRGRWRWRWKRALRAMADHAYLALSLAGVATYLPLHEDPRFMAQYLAILALTAFLLACRHLRPTLRNRVVITRLGLAAIAVAAITFAYSAIKPVHHVAAQVIGGQAAPGTDNELIAEALARAGVQAGSRIAFVGDSASVLSAYWARLDQARVVGNVDDVHGAFWRLAPAAQTRRLSLLRARSGARFVVTDEPQARSEAGWVPISGTGDSYRTLVPVDTTGGRLHSLPDFS